MHVTTRNINTAFHSMIQLFHRGSRDGQAELSNDDRVPVVKKPSRNGNVLMIDEPVTITYTHPRERVLFNPSRDANPFFHLYESLWMLAGRCDVGSVAYYAKQMKEYSDDGQVLNGAYGYRWRQMEWNRPEVEHFDQLDWLVQHLKGDPTSRRAVLQMWTVENDLLNIGIKGDPRFREQKASKDVCCNLSVMFSVREVVSEGANPPHPDWKLTERFLDMTVTNRSNDLVWGCLGANYVHFTFLQEYMAGRLGAEVGKYHHFTNNLHVYDWNWKPEEWLQDNATASYTPTSGAEEIVQPGLPLIADPLIFEKELPLFVSAFSGVDEPTTAKGDWDDSFLAKVAAPMLRAFYVWKTWKDHVSALRHIEMVESADWRHAAARWIWRRIK